MLKGARWRAPCLVSSTALPLTLSAAGVLPLDDPLDAGPHGAPGAGPGSGV